MFVTPAQDVPAVVAFRWSDTHNALIALSGTGLRVGSGHISRPTAIGTTTVANRVSPTDLPNLAVVLAG